MIVNRAERETYVIGLGSLWRIGLDVVECHVGGHIEGELLQGSLGEGLRVTPVLLERHEFDDVPDFLLALEFQRSAIGFKFFLF